jgi:hypothetical protein
MWGRILSKRGLRVDGCPLEVYVRRWPKGVSRARSLIDMYVWCRILTKGVICRFKWSRKVLVAPDERDRRMGGLMSMGGVHRFGW